MRKITLSERLRYWFDNSLSGGTISLIGWLAFITLVMVLIASSILYVTKLKPEEAEEAAPVAATPAKTEETDQKTDAPNAEKTEEIAESAKEPEGYTFPEAIWQSLMRSMDAGSVAGDTGWAFRLIMLLVTLGGIFITGALISVLSSGLEAKLEELRKGRSFVCEENHTLILGWSSRIFLVIRELAAANLNATKPRVVILADRDKVEMEDEIRAQVGKTGNTKVICRSGSPIDLTDLEIVNPHATKSIIILSPEEFSDPDAQVIKMILAITNNPNRRAEKYHIVAELRDPKNIAAAAMVGKDEVELILPEDLVSRITVQTSRQTGLSIVYKELLDFGGDEIYFKNEPSLTGKTFGDALSMFADCALIGIESNGKAKLNPSKEAKIGANDRLIVIASDDDKIRVAGTANIQKDAIIERQAGVSAPERNLILGWNHKGETIIREMDNYVAKGSELTVIAEIAEAREIVETIASEMKNLKVSFVLGDSTDRKLLDSMQLTSYQHIILLCYGDNMEIQEADSKTLMTLLHLRDIEAKKGEAYSIVSEMLDVKNRALAEIAKADDFIVSDELAGLLLTQVSENKKLGKVFDDLFDADGAEIYLKPASDYVKTGVEVNFYTILEAAKRRNEIAIGYRLIKDAENAENSYGVRVNPVKTSTIKFTPDDKVIVLADG